MAVPEAAVNEANGTVAKENEIWRSRETKATIHAGLRERASGRGRMKA